MSSQDNANLVSILREAASIVERNEMSPLLYRALEVLHAYTERGGGKTTPPANSNNNNTTEPRAKVNTNNNSNSNNTNNKPTPNLAKPSFQRPIKSSSNLIANGWIEQQRRSKMRIAWKEILASLVEGRRANEETTLWIQRQVHDARENKSDLEALHQIPMKWIEEVNYLDFYGDFRFSIKVFNVQEDFVFRAADEDSCKQWIATLISARDASYGKDKSNKTSNTKTSSRPSAPSSTSPTAPAPSAPPPSAPGTSGNNHRPNRKTASSRPTNINSTINNNTASNNNNKPTPPSQSTSPRMSIKELKAIAHGAGYDTKGMERADLEKIARHYAPASTRVPAPQINANTKDTQPKSNNNANGSAATAAAAAAAAADAKRKEEEMRKRVSEMAMKDKAMAETERKRREEEAARKKKEEELRREREKWEEQWFKTSPPAPAPKTTPPAASAPQQQQANGGFDSNAFYGQNQQQHQQHFTANSRPTAPPPQTSQPSQPPPPPPPQQGPDPTSPINHKYAKAMSQQNLNTEQNEQARITAIKRNLLMTWALIPPTYNALRPIHQLLSTIHTVFPPAFEVKSHTYFSKWKHISPNDLVLSAAMGNSPDEEKVKKAVRKLRFFLHPDRLPRDLNGEQSFMCKMLWDVSNDAWEEFMKQKDDLDWIHK